MKLHCVLGALVGLLVLLILFVPGAGSGSVEPGPASSEFIQAIDPPPIR